MRKLTAFACIIALAAGLFSCKKDFTCTCTFGDEDHEATEAYIIKGSKSKATDECATYNNEAEYISCELN